LIQTKARELIDKIEDKYLSEEELEKKKLIKVDFYYF